MSVQKAAQINDAYQVLKQPISRVEYILALHDIDIRSEQKTLQDPLFLMEQMELREELEEINSEDELFDFDAKVDKIYKQYLLDVQNQLEASLWEQAAEQVRKLKFIAKLKNEIEQAEDRLFG
ncbi:hypothetical protein MACH09_05430 [Vibrio sp. MACH09]|nr:hypothetical protein MACH09_05430 [Vibrio sp. MACH09]